MAKSIKKIKELRFKDAVVYAQTRKGEEFHPKYYTDKEQFTDMMISQIRMEKDLKKYFRGYNKMFVDQFPWALYEAGGDVKELVESMPMMVIVDLQLDKVISDNMDVAYNYGGDMAKTDLKQSHDDLEGVVTKKYYQLARAHAKQINKTTKKMLIDTLESMRELEPVQAMFGKEENQSEGLLTAVTDKLESDKRAESIVDTETVSFFTGAGAVVTNFFSRFQKIKKRWLSIPDARRCDRCAKASSKGWVGKDYLYNVQFGLVKTPPAHSLCRDIIEYKTK